MQAYRTMAGQDMAVNSLYMETSQETNTFSESTIETLENVRKIFKVNNKDNRTRSSRSFNKVAGLHAVTLFKREPVTDVGVVLLLLLQTLIQFHIFF